MMEAIIEVANSEVVFAVLFIGLILWLFWAGTKHQAQLKADNDRREAELIAESDRREQKLMQIYEQQVIKADKREEQLVSYLEKNNEQLTNIAKTLEKVEGRMETNFLQVWKELGQKQDKMR